MVRHRLRSQLFGSCTDFESPCLYKMAYDMRGIQQIIPFSKKIFNVSMQLPGTAENEALWEIAKTQGGAAMDAEFTRQARALREKERKFRDPSEINF